MSPKPDRSGSNTQTVPAEDKKIQEALEKLRKEHDALQKKKIETDTTLQNLKEQLEDLKRRAEEEYGTSDVEELKALLARWREENAQKVAAYEEHIASIKDALERIEAQADTEPAS
ncbi:MAG: hypothetical protein WHS86_16100 [Desulfosoma sp.]